MKTSKNILINNYIDISIIKFLVLSNFNKSFFILSFLLTFKGFSQTSNLHISQNTQLIGLDQLYIDNTEVIPNETLQIKNINCSGTVFVHTSTLVYFQTAQKINIVFIDSQNKTKKYHKHKDNKTIVLTPKKTNKTTKVFVENRNSSSRASSFSTDFASIIPVNTFKKNNKIIAFAKHDVPYTKVSQKQNQVTSYHKNIIAYSLPIEYSNRPPPC